MVALCTAITEVRAEEYDRDSGGADLFSAIGIPTFRLKNTTIDRGRLLPEINGDIGMGELNDFLKESNDSEDIVAESLISDYKINGPSGTSSTDAKRLVAVLSILKWIRE